MCVQEGNEVWCDIKSIQIQLHKEGTEMHLKIFSLKWWEESWYLLEKRKIKIDKRWLFVDIENFQGA